MRKLLLTSGISLLSCVMFAQEQSDIPKTYTLETAADFQRYEKNVIETINWLEASVPGPSDKKKEASSFLMAWIEGSPDVSIRIQEDIVNFLDFNPELLLIFIGGWTKYALESRKFSDALNGNIQGIESVIDYYQRNKDLLKRDPKIEAYTELQKQRKLAGYIKNKVHTD